MKKKQRLKKLNPNMWVGLGPNARLNIHDMIARGFSSKEASLTAGMLAFMKWSGLRTIQVQHLDLFCHIFSDAISHRSGGVS